MKKSIITTTAVGALFATQAMADPIGGYGDGGTALQGVLNGITTSPAGASSINVNTDDLSDAEDSYWQVGGSGGSISTLVIELAGYSGSNTFGVYDAANPSNTVQLFAGSDGVGDQQVLSITADGSVVLGIPGVDTGVDFAGNNFGFYLISPEGTFYSDTSLNEVDDFTTSAPMDHMVAFQGEGDEIQIPGFSPGPWVMNEYILAFEDLTGDAAAGTNGPDRDYTDFVVLVESVSPVPDGGTTVALFGLSILGLGFAGRKKLKK